jgi:transposase
MLSRWRKRAREGLIVATKRVELDADVAAELKELRKLKKAHERLRMKHAIPGNAIEFTSRPGPTSSPSSIIMKRRGP